MSGYGITDAYNKTEVDTKINAKSDKATTLSGYGITDAYTKTEADNKYAPIDASYTKSESDSRYVNATGDTMSDNLTVAKDQGTYNIKEPNLDYTSNPTSQHISAFRCLDKNNKILGDIRFVSDTNGTQTTSIFARHARTGSEKNAILSVILDKDGNDRVSTNNLSVTTAFVSSRLLLNNFTSGVAIQANTSEVNKGTIHAQNTAYDNTSTTVPSAHTYIQRYRGFDKNGKEAGCYEVVHDTSNNVRSIIRTSRIISGVTKTANLNVGVRANGNRYVQFDTDEFIITGKIVPYVTERVVSGTSYYEIWSDGWIVQGGRVSNTAADGTVTLVKSFKDTNYLLTVTTYVATSTDNNGTSTAAFPSNLTVNSFRYSKNTAQGFMWVACGY